VQEVELFESVPNFSEGRDRGAIDSIAAAAVAAHVLDVHPDPDHHRTVVSLAGVRQRLEDALLGAIGAAAERIDLRTHTGVHPRIGAADVVPIVPLGPTRLDQCHDVAQRLGERVWRELKIPVYFYGYGADRTLADIRNGRARPDLGGPQLHPSAGAVCIGARPLLVAFNLLLSGMSVHEARELARSLREARSGMRGVQALVFELPGDRLQLSMNLFRVDETPPDAVLDTLRRRGVKVVDQELVGLCPAAAANEAAGGRLLEGRLGAAVAREGARRARQRGGEELDALAARLDTEADGLAHLAAGQSELLAGAERCGAMPPVLNAAGVLDAEVETFSLVAARGLRLAIRPDTAAAYHVRIAALDRRLNESA
jgi:glutamate formiminotransferase